MIEAIRSSWRRIPAPVCNVVRKTGLVYAANYLATYREMQRRERFAGNLVGLQQKRPQAESAENGPALEAALQNIFESLVLPNGVRKTTTAGRQLKTLQYFLNRPERPPEGAHIRVLDLPSSNGVASVDSYNLLCGHYAIQSYVLADLCLELQYDRKRNAIYDSNGKLLQVQGGNYFFSVFRAHTSGPAHTILSDLLLLPLSLRARQLQRQYALDGRQSLETIRLLHPEAERQLARGVFTARNADVFALPWVDEFELVLSFNLLQKNYFPPAKIAEGLENLGRALKEGGYLVTGNTESFGVMRKTNGVLVTQYQQGEW